MDIIFLLVPVVVLLIAATIIVRRWRGWWRATAVVPLGGSALAVVSLRGYIWSHNWSGYDAVLRFVSIVAATYFLIGIIVVARAAARARSTESRPASR
jgi:hypothetical protein